MNRMRRGDAYSPGHITLFFEVCRDPAGDILKTGSRGVGICVDPGVMTKVTTVEKEELIEAIIKLISIEEENNRYINKLQTPEVVTACNRELKNIDFSSKNAGVIIRNNRRVTTVVFQSFEDIPVAIALNEMDERDYLCDIEGESLLKEGQKGSQFEISCSAGVELLPISITAVKQVFDYIQTNRERVHLKNKLNELWKNKSIMLISSVASLPVGQGFGMSAAGAVSIIQALSRFFKLNMTRLEVARQAHEVEIKNACGLGDVAGLFRGGVPVRKIPGIPPNGLIDSVDICDLCSSSPAITDSALPMIPPSIQLFYTVVGKKIPTSSIIKNKEAVEKINSIGRKCIEEFLSNPGIDSMTRLGVLFAEEIGILDERMKTVMEKAVPYPCAVAMLGRSVICFGADEELGKRWKNCRKMHINFYGFL